MGVFFFMVVFLPESGQTVGTITWLAVGIFGFGFWIFDWLAAP
jgi:hypothetical protein